MIGKKKEILCDGFMMNLVNMKEQGVAARKLLGAKMTLKVLQFLVLRKDTIVVKCAITIPMKMGWMTEMDGQREEKSRER